jgi:RNA polymerase sigma-70 factor (ECF subfamily)
MESDEALMVEIAQGSEPAFRELLRRYQRPLSGYLRRQSAGRAVDVSEVEDLFQEVWLRVARSAGSFRPSARFRPWLYRIALNVVRDFAGGRSPAAVDSRFEPVAEPTAREGAALEAERMLEALAPEQREVVMLRYYLDLSEAEMSEVLDVPRGTVKSRLHAAMSRLSTLAREKDAES